MNWDEEDNLHERFLELNELYTEAKFKLSKARRLLADLVSQHDCSLDEDGRCTIHRDLVPEDDEICYVGEARDFLNRF